MNDPSAKPPKFSAIHTFGLATFAISLPILLALSGSPEFFFAHGLTQGQMVAFDATVGLVVPVAIALIVAVVNAVPLSATNKLAWGVAGLIAILGILPTANRLEFLPGTLCVVLAFMVGASVVFAYARSRIVREFCSLLAIAGLIYPLWFAWRLDLFRRTGSPEVQHGAAVNSLERPPVIWLTFDEFGIDALLDETGAIDASRFPNFAALAADSVWIRDTNAVAEMTTEAIPAQVSGRYPASGKRVAPIYLEYPENLFTVLHAAGYRVYAHETMTRLCPPRINLAQLERPSPWPAVADDVGVVLGHLMLGRVLGDMLPDTSRRVARFREPRVFQAEGRRIDNLMDAADFRMRMFDEFMRHLGDRSGELHFLHLNFPHRAYQYLASGRVYLGGIQPTFDQDFLGINGGTDPSENQGLRTRLPYSLALSRQRYLLQVQFADVLLGRLVGRLKQLDIYDECVLVVVADHGVSFEPGQSDRLVVLSGENHVGEANHARDILKVPLFIRAPGLKLGSRIDALAETVDVLPTLLDVLGLSARSADGRTMLKADIPYEHSLRVLSHMNAEWVEHDTAADAPGYLAARWAMNLRGENFRPQTKWDEQYLRHGLSAVALREGLLDGVHAELQRASELADVDLLSNYLPALITAELFVAEAARAPVAVAIGFNGTIEAIAIPTPDAEGRLWVRAMIPESRFVEGANRVELCAIDDEVGIVPLRIEDGSAP